MSDAEEYKLKRRVKVFVVTAMSLFFVLVVVVVFQFAIRINNESTQNALEKQNEVLKQQIDRAKNDELYFRSEQFKRDYLFIIKNIGRLGDKTFE